jgi:uncharacterized protein (TIGR04145 family)
MKCAGERKNKVISVAAGCVLALTTVLSVVQPVSTAAAAETTDTAKAEETAVEVTVDGDLSDWKAVDELKSKDSDIESWKLAKSNDGKTLYLAFSGKAVSQWDGKYNYKTLSVKRKNGTKLEAQISQLSEAWAFPGAEVKTVNDASGNVPGPYAVECSLPLDETGYTVTFAGTEVNEASIPVYVPADKYEAVYNGITIDSKYDDWDAIEKTEASCPEEANHNYDCLDSVACVFDGDTFYIYLKDGKDGSAAGAGTHSNGRYAIVADTGRQIVFALSTKDGGTVSGVKGAKVAHYGKQWEVSIPASALPLYSESLSFGLYQQEPFVADIMNIQEKEGTAGTFGGIVYDGHYGDWDAYPHTLIEYATSGTQTDKPDGEGALYTDDSILYGHVVSPMDAHLKEMGGEFTSAISICFNGKRKYNEDKTWNLYPRLVAVADDGTIDWNPKLSGLDNGTYEFYIADTRGEYDTNTLKNVSDLKDYEQFFGKMTITVGETSDEMEFYVDLEKVANFLSHYKGSTVDASEFKLIEAQFGRIGQQWLVIGGTSSGPYMGVSLCVLVAGVVLLRRRRTKVVKE